MPGDRCVVYVEPEKVNVPRNISYLEQVLSAQKRKRAYLILIENAPL